MPTDICLGNGQLVDNSDLEGHLGDIPFPYGGKENQADGCIFGLGTFRADGWRCVRQQLSEQSDHVPGNPRDLDSLRDSRWRIARKANPKRRSSIERTRRVGERPQQVHSRTHALPPTSSHAFFRAAFLDRAEPLSALRAPK